MFKKWKKNKFVTQQQMTKLYKAVNFCVIFVSCGELYRWQSYHIFFFTITTELRTDTDIQNVAGLNKWTWSQTFPNMQQCCNSTTYKKELKNQLSNLNNLCNCIFFAEKKRTFFFVRISSFFTPVLLTLISGCYFVFTYLCMYRWRMFYTVCPLREVIVALMSFNFTECVMIRIFLRNR